MWRHTEGSSILQSRNKRHNVCNQTSNWSWEGRDGVQFWDICRTVYISKHTLISPGRNHDNELRYNAAQYKLHEPVVSADHKIFARSLTCQSWNTNQLWVAHCSSYEMTKLLRLKFYVFLYVCTTSWMGVRYVNTWSTDVVLYSTTGVLISP